jgi:hypothetical protein
MDTTWPDDLATDADRARFARYRRAITFVEGQQWTERARRGESRLTMNYARTLLRKTASYVFPAPVRFAVSPRTDTAGDTAAAGAAEQWLNRLDGMLGLSRLDLALANDVAVLGDGVLKVTWRAGMDRPRVTAVDPAAIVARTEPDDPTAVIEIAHRYGVTARDLPRLFPGLTQTATSAAAVPVLERWTETTWEVMIAGQVVLREANPYGWIPYVIAANQPGPHDLWGRSDLCDLEDVCREINRRTTVLSRVLELSGAPIAVLENVDGSEGIAVGPGAKWELPEGAKAYLLDLLQGGGAQIHIAYLDVLFRILHDLSETPRTAFGDSGRDLSGAALEVEIQPLVQKVGRQRRMWDTVFARRNVMLLDLAERFGEQPFAGHRETTTIWPPVLPSDTDASVRNAVSRVQAGIQSRYDALAQLGSEHPEVELARIDRERRQDGVAQVPAFDASV